MKEDRNSQTLISVKLSLQIIMFVFCAVVFLSLVTGGALFGVAGKAINAFILGALGHSSYPLFVAAIYFAIKLFSGKKFSARKKSVYIAVSLFLSAVMCYHLLTSSRFLGGDFGSYLAGCFDAGVGGVSEATGGGALFGVLVYPFVYLFDIVGSYIIFSLIFALSLLILFGGKVRRPEEGGFVGVKPYPTDYFERMPQEYPQYPPQAQVPPAGYMRQPEAAREASADEPAYQPEEPVIKNSGKIEEVPKKLFVGYLEDYVNPKAKKSKTKSKSFDILYSNRQPEGYQVPVENKENKLGGASYTETFGDDFESKKKYILTPVDNILRPYNDYGFGDRGQSKAIDEKPPKINHNMGTIDKTNPYQKYANDSVERQDSVKPQINFDVPKNNYIDNLNNLMDKYSRGYSNLSGEVLPPQPPQPQNVDEDKDFFMQDDYADDIESKDMEDAGAEHPPVVINRYDGADRAKKKDDLFKYQTQIGVDENKTPVIKAPYMAPPVSLLREVVNDSAESVENYEEKIQALESALSDFKVPAKVVSVTPGPTVTRYELQMPPGVPVSRLTSRANDIAMCLASNGEIRIEAPIPGKSLLGIELPNQKRQKVWLKELIDSAEFMNKKSAFTFALGKEISGKNIILDFTKMPHLLVAGSTGSGKSVCLNTLIISLLYKASPDDVRMILIDPKRVEFNVYNGLPHLMIKEVITDAEKAISAFNWAIGEMEKRFLLFRDTVSKDIISYNEKMKESGGQTLPRIFIIVDELAELMMINKRELEEKIKKISQLSRAAGIHLILATQRPSVDIITGVIKANLNSRVTFKLMTQADSRTVIDCSGAEKLLGEGDMIFISNNMPKPIRLQGPFVSMEEVEAIVDFVKQNNEAYFDEEIENDIYNYSDGEEDEETEDSDETDKYFIEALKLAIEAGQISISMVQRRFAVGYSRAGKIIDELERRKFISPFEGSKPRQVLITKEEFERRFGGGEDF